jgi:hypothetical protein
LAMSVSSGWMMTQCSRVELIESGIAALIR